MGLTKSHQGHWALYRGSLERNEPQMRKRRHLLSWASWGRGGELTFPVHLWYTFHSYFFLLPFYFLFSDPNRSCKTREKDFLGGPVVKTPHFQCSGVRVWPLVRELRSHMLCGTAKQLKNKTTEGGTWGLLVCKTHHMQSPCWNFVQLWTSSLVWNFQ